MLSVFAFFFFNDTATTEIYTLSLHDALPISERFPQFRGWGEAPLRPLAVEAITASSAGTVFLATPHEVSAELADRKSTRLNSSHSQISYAVFCLKKKQTTPPSLCHDLQIV